MWGRTPSPVPSSVWMSCRRPHRSGGGPGLTPTTRRRGPRPPPPPPPPAVARYVTLFNRHDWDGLRAMLADDVRLIQSSYPLRAGASDVSMFFGIYARSAP